MVQRTGISRAVVNRSQPHFWSWSRVAIGPGGKVLPGRNHHLLLESRADMALVSLRWGVVCGDGSVSSWLGFKSLSPLPWQADVVCPAHLVCAHQ